ncbi:hypothetical protein [Streptomyces sp. PA5.6]|uniref:hypothetical protein n=1 Tax=Streptomyces sp. PA5.6 TaxID=3035651 RepID=UPI00390485C5
MSAVAASPAAVGASAPVRRQRVRVPMRLVSSSAYADVALSVYVKVKALGLRPEGCQAKSTTIASYLGLSPASVERGMTQLRRPGPDGVVELFSNRRTLPGGTGTSAVRTVRAMTRTEAFVWLPVAAAEDLTPRQLRAFALMAYAQARGIALTEAELAAGLRHHSGQKAGQPLSVTAASAVVDEVEAAHWVTVRRRAGARGRHRYIAHDIAPEARPDGGRAAVVGAAEAAVTSGSEESISSQVGEGSGSPVGEGSLANEESPRTDSPVDERAFFSAAVGEVPVVEAAGAVENPAPAPAVARTEPDGDLALRAGGKSQPCPSEPEAEKRSSRGGGAHRSSYDGPELTMSPQIYAVLEPVHLLLERVQSDFAVRQIAREVGRQLREGTDAERLRHRLTARFARVMLSEIRDPGRWLLGVALPRWGCGHLDCESGVRWSNGERCAVCEEVVADKFAARQRAQRLEHGPCHEHGGAPGLVGMCPDCGLQSVEESTVPPPTPRELDGPPRGSCGGCGCRIFLTGRALEDGLCKLCREEATALAAPSSAVPDSLSGSATCRGLDGVPCGRRALPTRRVCARHLAQELALAGAEAS